MISKTTMISTMKDYIEQHLNNDLAAYSSDIQVKTGFRNIDDITSIRPGLYVIGAPSSLGKTTFLLQMADQMASHGTRVLYLSYEQTTLELISKSLSRIMATRDFCSSLTSVQIRERGSMEELSDILENYRSYANNLTILECGYNYTFEDIREIILHYLREKDFHPVIILDYLQVIQKANTHQSDKESVDYNIRCLKQLQKDYRLTIFVISSFNRQNYYLQTGVESFKESGDIEYTADVLWGLQLDVLNNPLFECKGAVNEKRLMFREALGSSPRIIELVCVKNRFGPSDISLKFEYYPQYDLFIPVQV